MTHLVIDNKLCTGCGICKSVCIRDNIEIVDDIAVEVGGDCFDCGQCSTICKQNAIALKAYQDQMDRIEEYDPRKIPVSYDDMLQFLKQRRTCRWFRNEKIDIETFEKIMEGAYYSPNRQNIQDVEFAILDEQLDEFIDIVYDIISAKEEEFFRIKQLGDYLRDPERNPKGHPLLWEGKQLILAFSEAKTDAVIAMTRIELLAYTLGLGGFHSLFINMADEIDHQRLMEFFPNIDSNKHMYAAFVIGYPRVRYRRTRPHEEIKVTYM